MAYGGLDFDVAVVGAGPAGMSAALSLTQMGARVALIGPRPAAVAGPNSETRTAALLTSSVDLLKRLGVWQALAPQSAPLKAVQIVDASRSLFRSPDITFRASELGLPAFGYNIANTALNEVLYTRAEDDVAEVMPASVVSVDISTDSVRLTLDDGRTITAALLAGADGRRSICREAAGIETTAWQYDQQAIASNFRHSRPHDGVSTELHKEAGSLTSVPMPDAHQSALIWIGPTKEIEALMSGSDADFASALQGRMGDVLGSVGAVGPRASFPVAGLNARSLAHNRTALIGEAAHIMPPIGAQGLNLGLRDAAVLADCVSEALGHNGDPGGLPVLTGYIKGRQLDVMSRAVGVDLLNRSLLTSLLPVQIARGAVLTGLNAIGPLKRFVMRVGLEPPSDLPSLMRPSGGPSRLPA